MTYLAILGRQPQLSLAELEAVVGADPLTPFGHHALLSESVQLNRLGGCIKLAQVVAEDKSITSQLLDTAASTILESSNPGKLTVGLSFYGPKSSSPTRLAMELKRRLKQDRSVRLVLPKLPQTYLSAAQIKFNGGQELIIATSGSRVVAAITEQVQDIDAYSQRDYDRPSRDSRVGMLPPKLAQILINLAGLKRGTIIDPFCGSGVILQEARLLGFRAIGSDIDPAMVTAARHNLDWLSQQQAGLPDWQVSQADARTASVDQTGSAIVSENYLGPALTHRPNPTQLRLADLEVSKLTRDFLVSLKQSKVKDFPIVLCLPQWQLQTGPHDPQVVDEIPDLGYTLRKFHHVDHHELIYLRAGQIVGRKIIVMRPNNESR